jgi:hypothetical protein
LSPPTGGAGVSVYACVSAGALNDGLVPVTRLWTSLWSVLLGRPGRLGPPSAVSETKGTWLATSTTAVGVSATQVHLMTGSESGKSKKGLCVIPQARTNSSSGQLPGTTSKGSDRFDNRSTALSIHCNSVAASAIPYSSIRRCSSGAPTRDAAVSSRTTW